MVILNGDDGLAIGVTDTGTPQAGADRNVIGGPEPDKEQPSVGNAFSGNGGNGVSITLGSGNVLEGNVIGINQAVLINPTEPFANGAGNFQAGVLLVDAPGTTIGGTTAAASNVISGNGQDGITITGADATGELILKNLIGTDPTGTLASETVNGASGPNTVIHYANTGDGVRLIGASLSVIGSAGAGNVIGNNGGDGIAIQAGSTSNLVQGNSVGINTAFNNKGVLVVYPLGNFSSGVVIDSQPGRN